MPPPSAARFPIAAVGAVPSADAVYAANQTELESALAGTVPPDGPAATPAS